MQCGGDEQQIPILDTRFQAFSRYYIYDILNAEIIGSCMKESEVNSNESRSLIRIHGVPVRKVALCGMISDIYEDSKYFRLKIEDSTGCIGVTLWKNTVFSESSLEFISSNQYSPAASQQFSDLYNALNSIKMRIKDDKINSQIIYEPSRGDHVLVRGSVKTYLQRIEISASSCVRVQNASEEMIQMMLPAILFKQTYSIDLITQDDYESRFCKEQMQVEERRVSSKTTANSAAEFESMPNKNAFVNLVYKKLVEMSSVQEASMLNHTDTSNTNHMKSCDSHDLFSYLRNNCPTEFKFVSFKLVLAGLKELEMRGLAYSCEDEFHYLPIQ